MSSFCKASFGLCFSFAVTVSRFFDTIHNAVRAAGLFHLYGAEGSTNVQGEIVKKLDVIANDAMITALTRSDTVCS
jgi:fructose-1,6-bisphosphatase